MPDKKIVAFYSPYPQAGKSTARKIIDINKVIYICSFAAPIKEMVLTLEALYGDDVINNRELGLSARDFNIAIGQGLKQLDPDIWVRIMDKYIENHSDALMVIDDLRFPNEYAMLKDKGARIVRISNPEREIVKTDTEGLLEGFDFDYELVNYKRSLEEYQAQIDKMMSELWP